ncbi:DUF2076 domain-containing protein [Glaciimonas immobilis]|uniref:DUF2076 domain-containing protein n=1 Tax=Glaciimonas immobilis TaxID=728004 RepID=A0A840RSQ7_9BURK|nr:DUF2076 family protein [Glaciimonas immobilis]KAF3997852.1 DUF2076 family protein [Glaciimonas immobilis]MBB5199509.1 hypothetical protein [Glaciimonas immobilis]
MTPQESQPLQDFLNQLIQVRGIAKDPQADALINNAVAQQPDAAYLLVQRALLIDQALTTAKAQIATLQRQIQTLQTQPSPSTGFLDANAWGNTAATPAAPLASRPAAPMMAAPAQAYAPPMQNAASAPSPGFFGGGAGGMLGTVAATAAGVAGGAFLFQGIEHLMHPNSGAGFMNQAGMSPSAAPVENSTVNNYYGDSDKEEASDNTADDSTDDTASNDSGGDDSSLI